MEDEQEQLRKRVERVKKRVLAYYQNIDFPNMQKRVNFAKYIFQVDAVPNNDKLIFAARQLRREREKEAKLASQLQTQRNHVCLVFQIYIELSF